MENRYEFEEVKVILNKVAQQYFTDVKLIECTPNEGVTKGVRAIRLQANNKGEPVKFSFNMNFVNDIGISLLDYLERDFDQITGRHNLYPGQRP